MLLVDLVQQQGVVGTSSSSSMGSTNSSKIIEAALTTSGREDEVPLRNRHSSWGIVRTAISHQHSWCCSRPETGLILVDLAATVAAPLLFIFCALIALGGLSWPWARLAMPSVR